MTTNHLTQFGRFLRKLRIDRELNQKQMAISTQVSPAYLSALEYGEKHIPDRYVDKLIQLFALSDNEADELRIAVLNSQPFIKIDLKNVSADDRKICITFARKFPSLNADQIKDLRAILAKG